MVLLGDFSFQLAKFRNLNSIFDNFRSSSFQEQSAHKRFRIVNETLLKLIRDFPTPCFLLHAIVEYMALVNQYKILKEFYHFTQFEFWLNHFSSLSDEEELIIRGKIVGKVIPRDDYQVFFPIGMGKTLAGTHFVTAHLSPDVDTTIASFWGWIDAIGAKVGTGQHIWSLPGGPPLSPIQFLFESLFGKGVFELLSRPDGTLTLTAMDLVSRKNVSKERGQKLINLLDHGRYEKAVILIDEADCFAGDWHSSDVEIVRQVVVLFKSCLHWFENNTYTKLVSLFSKPELSVQDIPPFIHSIFDIAISASDPFDDFSENQKADFDRLLKEVIGLKQGIESSFADLSESLKKENLPNFGHFRKRLEALKDSTLFDSGGRLIENRPEIFNYIQGIIQILSQSILALRDYSERLDVSIKIKQKVLNIPSYYVTMRTDIDAIKTKIKTNSSITVVAAEDHDKVYPIGVVWAEDLRKNILGTVSWRDFSNPEECKMASYLSVASVIDHHKSDVSTPTTPTAMIADAQSCNVLVAEEEMRINSRYSTGGLSVKSMQEQLDELLKIPSKTPSDKRLLQRVLNRQLAHETVNFCFIHPDREMAEYLLLLHAILDDTDLLTKMSQRDVYAVAGLLNRMKSIQVKKDVEIISFDDLRHDSSFTKKAAKLLLQNEDLYSIYRNVFSLREQEVDTLLENSLSGSCGPFFEDTKEQNGCCRIGQTKIFSSNYANFLKAREILLNAWLETAKNIHKERPEIDLHLHMISTIPSAEEVYRDQIGNYGHEDELWIFVKEAPKAYDHLASFLEAFKTSPDVIELPMRLEIPSEKTEEISIVFARHFKPVNNYQAKSTKEKDPFAILHFKAGALNSRKAMISPYLPRLLS